MQRQNYSMESNKRFWQNVDNYISANKLNPRKFGEKVSAYTQDFSENSKEYGRNDISQYISRCSVPKDLLALVAIAKIIGKPLEDLIELEFSIDELKSDKLPESDDDNLKNANDIADENIIDSSIEDETEKWSIDKWNDFDIEEQQFIKDLLYSGAQKGSDGKWHIILYGEVYCGIGVDEVQCVGIWIGYGKKNIDSRYEEEKYIEVPLDVFVKKIMDDVWFPGFHCTYAVSQILKEEVFEKYINSGLLELPDEIATGDEENFNYNIGFNLDITLNIDCDEILQLQAK